MSLFRQAPALCGRLFAASAAASAAAAGGACPHAGVAAAAVGAAAVAARKTPSPTQTTQVCGFSAAAAAPTIFEKLGGKPAVTAAVEKFYQKVRRASARAVGCRGEGGAALRTLVSFFGRRESQNAPTMDGVTARGARSRLTHHPLSSPPAPAHQPNHQTNPHTAPLPHHKNKLTNRLQPPPPPDEQVLADPTVNTFFKGVDMAAQKRKQMSFMMFAFGGPEAYKGKDMFEAHKKMDLKEELSSLVVVPSSRKLAAPLSRARARRARSTTTTLPPPPLSRSSSTS
jgi:truncated hemoglobin YjbI